MHHTTAHSPCLRTACWVLAVACLASCTKNTDEQRATAKAAADAYCACGEAAMTLPGDQFAALEQPCAAESAAFSKAWEALPTRADGDPAADAIFGYKHACYRLLHDTLDVARERNAK